MARAATIANGTPNTGPSRHAATPTAQAHSTHHRTTSTVSPRRGTATAIPAKAAPLVTNAPAAAATGYAFQLRTRAPTGKEAKSLGPLLRGVAEERLDGIRAQLRLGEEADSGT